MGHGSPWALGSHGVMVRLGALVPWGPMGRMRVMGAVGLWALPRGLWALTQGLYALGFDSGPAGLDSGPVSLGLEPVGWGL